MVSAGNNLSIGLFSDSKTGAIVKIIQQKETKTFHNVLVVGCGSGIEAAILAQRLKTKVIGIDIAGSFDTLAATYADLRQGDATCLDFPDESFDLVYSYHTLEHIPDYRKALAEMRRVLTSGGIFCIGVPNRLRLLGYIGSKDATLANKFRWNITDWKARLQGKFRNEYGAHAGYSVNEIRTELGAVFSFTFNITLNYYVEVYCKHNNLVRLLNKSLLCNYLFPSIYFMGRK